MQVARVVAVALVRRVAQPAEGDAARDDEAAVARLGQHRQAARGVGGNAVAVEPETAAEAARLRITLGARVREHPGNAGEHVIVLGLAP